MNTRARRLRFWLPLLAGLVVIAVAFAGSAAISNRAIDRGALDEPKAQTSVLADELDAQADAALPDTEEPPRVMRPDGGATRRMARCPDCGVVESVRRIRRREIAASACSVLDSDRSWIRRNVHDSCGVISMAMHEVSVEDMLAGQGEVGTIVAPPSYQIVVRFRDGSRRVFHERTARALQAGDRVQVIAGVEFPAE